MSPTSYFSRLVLATFALLMLSPHAVHAQVSIQFSPPVLNYGNVAVGQTSPSQFVTVTNTGSQSVFISVVSVSPSEFTLIGGVPTGLKPGGFTHYTMTFTPDKAQAFNGTLSLTIAKQPFSYPLTGTGISTSAAITVSPSSLNFPNQPVGSTSPSQTLTVSNTGSSSVMLTVTTIEPPFMLSGPAVPVQINPGSSVSYTASYFPSFVGSSLGSANFVFDVVPSVGSTLSGNSLAATGFVVNTFPSLPRATASGPYQAVLSSTGGTGTVTWSVVAPSKLVSGLALSSAGVISGTLTSSVKLGTYNVTVQATDSSSPPKTARGKLSYTVYTQTGSNCNEISFNVPGTSTPMVPLTDLGPGTYLGFQGGLYPNGSNVRPSDHDLSGVNIAKGIQPLNANGQPDPNGSYALMSIGISTTEQPFIEFQTLANGDPAKNSHLVIVNGAQGGASAHDFADPTSPVWTTLISNILPSYHVTTSQVVAAWVEDIDAIPTQTFPNDAISVQGELESIAQNLHSKFPNLVVMYLTGRIYGAYSIGVNPNDPEPYAYQNSFAAKWAIQDQLNGLASLNFDPTKGPVLAPWMAWGPYHWANGMIPRSDGLVWTCQDFKPDGLHPSIVWGRDQEGMDLLNFFKSDDTTTPWFLAPGH